MLQITWLALGIVIFAASLRAAKSRRALQVGRFAVAVLYLGAGALVNTVLLAAGEDYAEFADGAYVAFVRDTWRSLVVPNSDFFILLLVVFEAAVGALVLGEGRRAQLGLAAAIAFHIALVSFGWGFYLWSVPMVVALSLLLRAQLRAQRRPPLPEPERSEELIRAGAG